MDAKLTLRLDNKVIERAKAYAKIYNTSLSKIIEAYLDSLTQRENREAQTPLTPLVESLHGIGQLPPGFDEKNEYFNFLLEKHSPKK